MNLEKLKETARRFEQKEEWKKAIDVYLKAIAEVESGRDSHPDLAVYNRLGDLYLKISENNAAIRAYERAAELYAEQGFFNNAIALCGKILRLNPQRSPVYLRLAALHARKNVVIEAKRNLLAYMERMHSAGQLDEAFAAVRQSADEFSGNQELRLMLVDLLKAASREDEAQDELRKVAAVFEARGDATAAASLRSGLVEIDVDYSASTAPSLPRTDAAPAAAQAPEAPAPASKTSDLVFLDVAAGDYDTDDVTVEPAAPIELVSAALADDFPLILGEPFATNEQTEPIDPDVLPNGLAAPNIPLDGRSFIEAPFEGMEVMRVEGLESASLETDDEIASAAPALDGLEVLATFDATTAESAGLEDVERHDTFTSVEETLTPIDGLQLDEEPVVEVDLDAPIPEATDEVLSEAAAEALDAVSAEVDAAPLSLATEADEVAAVAEVDLPSDDALLLDLELARDGEPLDAFASDASSLVDEPEALVDVAEGATDTEFDVETTIEIGGDEPTRDVVLEIADDDVVLDVEMLPEEDAASVAASEDAALAALADDLPEPASLEPEAVAGTLRTLIEALEEQVADNPDDPMIHHRLADALLDAGDVDRALEELAHALLGYEAHGEFDLAWGLADRLVAMQPDTIRFHQKRVEIAFRLEDRPRLIEAYLALGDSLIRADAVEKALAVYRRVLDHDPANREAHGALEAYAPRPAPTPPAVTPPAPATPVPPQGPVLTSAVADDGFIDFGAMILEPEPERDTRMTTAIQPPTGDEDRDFEEALAAFKRGIEANLADTDYEAHYDLGIAFKEMGLLDESIAEFQKALRAPDGRLRTSEALGQAFMEKGQTAIAEAVLRRAVESLEGGDDLKVGVLYWLGRSTELQGRTKEAVAAYERALAVDIRFADVSERLARLGAGRS